MAIANAADKLGGRKPKLTASQDHLVHLHRTGENTTREIAKLFKVARSRLTGRSNELAKQYIP
jgi:hypothetical protein